MYIFPLGPCAILSSVVVAIFYFYRNSREPFLQYNNLIFHAVSVKNLEIPVNRNSLLAMAPMLNFRLAQMIQSLFTTTQ